MILRGLLFLGCLAALPRHDDPWTAEVVKALEGARTEFRATSAQVVGGIRTSVLTEGSSWSLPVPLKAGVAYTVVAACDRDCGQLALRVTDPRRYDLDADQSSTRRPASRFVAQVAGVHEVVVTMRACRIDPCRVGVIILER